ncbi:MAG: CapA family protein [Clostridiales bacterium]|nr:CapA family protein [Clostridiales bacterium]
MRVKKRRLYKLLMFDVIALAIIFVAVVCIRLDISFEVQNHKADQTELLFTQTLMKSTESLSKERLSPSVGDFINKDLLVDDELPSQEDVVEENTTVLEQVHMSIAGDVLFSTSPLNKYDSGNGITSILSVDLLDTMNSSDITMVNLEFPFSTRGVQMEDKQYTFKADPSRGPILKEMGVDIVSLANNHTLDFGTEALLDTITTLRENNILSVGAGEDLEAAKKPSVSTIKGRNIAFLGASRVIPVTDWNATKYSPGVFTTYDPTLLIEEIKLAKQSNDLVIVYVHWGIEKEEYPEEYQRTMAKQYIDAGADLVLGSHPHVLQGIEFYNGKPIVYSLGNFVFGHTIERTVLLDVTIDEQNLCNIRLIPCETKDAYTHTITSDDKVQEFYSYYEGISYGIKIDKYGNVIKE